MNSNISKFHVALENFKKLIEIVLANANFTLSLLSCNNFKLFHALQEFLTFSISDHNSKNKQNFKKRFKSSTISVQLSIFGLYLKIGAILLPKNNVDRKKN